MPKQTNDRHFNMADLRFPELRAMAAREANQILRADNARRRRMIANNQLRGAKPVPTKTARDAGPFAALKAHPAYRAPRNGASRRT